LIQERAYFKDRAKPTFIEHSEKFVQQWRGEFLKMIAEGRVRDMPFEKFNDVMSGFALWHNVYKLFRPAKPPHRRAS